MMNVILKMMTNRTSDPAAGFDGMNFVLKMMKFVLNMMNFVFKMTDFAFKDGSPDESQVILRHIYIIIRIYIIRTYIIRTYIIRTYIHYYPNIHYPNIYYPNFPVFYCPC